MQPQQAPGSSGSGKAGSHLPGPVGWLWGWVARRAASLPPVPCPLARGASCPIWGHNGSLTTQLPGHPACQGEEIHPLHSPTLDPEAPEPCAWPALAPAYLGGAPGRGRGAAGSARNEYRPPSPQCNRAQPASSQWPGLGSPAPPLPPLCPTPQGKALLPSAGFSGHGKGAGCSLDQRRW